MKRSAALALIPALFAGAVAAQSFAPAPPPPGLNDPGSKPGAPARTAAAASSLAPERPARIVSGEPMPEVSVHRRGDNSVQEYRRNGQLYMVVITPDGGVPATYMVDPQGRVVDEHGQKPIRPVMYKVLEWGKSKPAAAASSGGG